MKLIEKPGMIMIGAAGRKSGKTLLACTLLKRFSQDVPIVAIKVTTVHDLDSGCSRGGEGCGVCSSMTDVFCITEEKEKSSGKDTSLLLTSGARRVFWLRVLKDHMREGVEAVLKLVPEGSFLVCESNSARTVVKPGVFLLVRNIHQENIKPSAESVQHYADRILQFDPGKVATNPYDFDLNLIGIRNGRWEIS